MNQVDWQVAREALGIRVHAQVGFCGNRALKARRDGDSSDARGFTERQGLPVDGRRHSRRRAVEGVVDVGPAVNAESDRFAADEGSRARAEANREGIRLGGRRRLQARRAGKQDEDERRLARSRKVQSHSAPGSVEHSPGRVRLIVSGD